MKKLLLGLGAMTVLAAPVVVAVSCGNDGEEEYTAPVYDITLTIDDQGVATIGGDMPKDPVNEEELTLEELLNWKAYSEQLLAKIQSTTGVSFIFDEGTPLSKAEAIEVQQKEIRIYTVAVEQMTQVTPGAVSGGITTGGSTHSKEVNGFEFSYEAGRITELILDSDAIDPSTIGTELTAIFSSSSNSDLRNYLSVTDVNQIEINFTGSNAANMPSPENNPIVALVKTTLTAIKSTL